MPKVRLRADNWIEYKQELDICMQGKGRAGEEIRNDLYWDYEGLEPRKPPEPWWLAEFTTSGSVEEIDNPEEWRRRRQTAGTAPAEPRAGPSGEDRLAIYRGYIEQLRIHSSEHKAWQDQVDKYMQTRGEIIAMLYYSTDSDIVESMRGAPDWDDIQRSSDSLAMHRLQREHCDAANSRNIQNYVTEFTNFEWREGETVFANINRFEALAKACEQGGHVFPGSEKAQYLAGAAPPSLAAATGQIIVKENITDADFEDLKKKLRLIAQRRKT